MSRYLSLALVLGVMLILSLPFSSLAQVYTPQQQSSPSSPQPYAPPQRVFSDSTQHSGSWYFSIKPGAYFPTGDLDDKGFDTGFAGELTMGTYYTRNLALEAGVGYFQTEASLNAGGINEEDTIWVIPVTVTFKGVLPLQYGMEITAGAGGGLYFTNIDADISSPAGQFSNEGSRTAIGGHVVAGGNINLSRNAFLGVEGKYIFTNSISLLGTKLHLDGFILTGVLGYRF